MLLNIYMTVPEGFRTASKSGGIWKKPVDFPIPLWFDPDKTLPDFDLPTLKLLRVVLADLLWIERQQSIP